MAHCQPHRSGGDTQSPGFLQVAKNVHKVTLTTVTLTLGVHDSLTREKEILPPVLMLYSSSSLSDTAAYAPLLCALIRRVAIFPAALSDFCLGATATDVTRFCF